MMYRNEEGRTLAISQPAHAWISGQLMRRLALPASEPLWLAGEQHDLGWLDWERAPAFDPLAGRPPSFREVGASVHAPMWTLGVERALAGWGPHVALLISRHGGRIYRRFGLPHAGARDKAAIEGYLAAQAPLEAAWAAGCGLGEIELDYQSTLIAFVDALSLAVCGALAAPAELELPVGKAKLSQRKPFDLRLDPWPFKGGAFFIEGEGRLLPETGRFSDEAAMRAWIGSSARVTYRTRLAPA